MNGKRSRLILSALATLALLAFPALATAKPGYEVRPKSLELDLGVKASDGYEASVHTVGHKQVTLTVEGHGGSASYQVDGQVSRHGIEADFGDFGHISVRFDGVRKPDRSLGGIPLPPGFLDRGCKGRDPVQEVGTFRGTIEFEGEPGFTAVNTKKAKGEVRRTYRRICKSGARSFAGEASVSRKRAKRPTLLSVFLLAAESSPARRTLFGTLSFESDNPELQALGEAFSFAFAEVEERLDAVRISRAAFAGVGVGSILISPPGKQPTTASLVFARPFVGVAKFVRKAGAPPAWTGSLGVRLPGAGLVHLTGAGFSARLCRNPLTGSAGERCEKRAEGELGIRGDEASASTQGSGSHSQAFAEARLSWSR